MMGNTYVDDIANAVLLFSNPVWSGDASIPSTVVKNITALSHDLAYSADLDSNITILNSKYAATQNGVIQGLLYVPELPANHPCSDLESIHIPASAVRQKDLPPADYNLIALVPWYNHTCTKAYMESAVMDPLRGFITYVPGSNSTEKPPDVGDPVWSLHDQGAWKKSVKFPVYAISASSGASMMSQLSLYSGNVSSVPYGSNITSMYSPNENDYVRIWTAIHIQTPSSLPTIWVFIFVSLGVMVAFVAIVSCLMHYFQRRRRRSLERRVVIGEVNLEAMNIKRVLVPIEHVESFPLFTYTYEPKRCSPPSSPALPQSPQKVHTRKDSVGRGSGPSVPTISEDKVLTSPRSTVTGITTTSTATDYQPQCTICLEDYENRLTIIRELPCGHIYHPDCIDEYLTENSSLCPQCKASMLPLGFCPPVTNAMVRRERALRRLRGRVTLEEPRNDTKRSRRSFTRKLYRPSKSAAAVAVQQPPDRQYPTAEVRTRMRNLAGTGLDDREDHIVQPRWKRLSRTVFPGFR